MPIYNMEPSNELSLPLFNILKIMFANEKLDNKSLSFLTGITQFLIEQAIDQNVNIECTKQDTHLSHYVRSLSCGDVCHYCISESIITTLKQGFCHDTKKHTLKIASKYDPKITSVLCYINKNEPNITLYEVRLKNIYSSKKSLKEKTRNMERLHLELLIPVHRNFLLSQHLGDSALQAFIYGVNHISLHVEYTE